MYTLVCWFNSFANTGMSLSRLQVPQIDYKPTHRLAPNFPGHPAVDG